MDDERPNILLLMTDQHRADHVGWARSSRLETPNLDRIADGTAFCNCVTADPVCTPARTALLTGKYPHQVGTLDMSGGLSRQHPTYMRALQRAGYHTAGIGKFHWMQGWPWSTERGGGHPLAAMTEEMKKYGLDYVWEVAGKQLAKKNYCDYCAYLDAKGLLEDYRDHVARRGSNTNDALQVNFQGDPWPFDPDDYVDAVTGRRIVEHIRNRPADRPFCIFGSFCGPHQPFDPPAPYLQMVPYEEEDNFIGQGAELPTEVKKRLWKLRRAYKAMILAIDEQVGRIFETLEDEGLLENTIVLFTADHGELMGEHGRMQKTNWHKGSTIVPTAIRHPDHLDRRRVDAPVELTDITATILDAAGLDPQEALSKPWPAFHDRVPCRSLLPVVRGEADRVRDFAFSEGRNGWQMIQTDRWRYIRRPAADPHSRDELLFNLDHDPRELHNLAREDKYADVLETMRMHVEYVMMHTPPAQLQWAPYEAMEGEIL